MQGDNGTPGPIGRHSVGKLIVENVINGTNIPDKVTFEVMTAKKGNDDHFAKPLLDFSNLQPDTAASVVQPDHVKGRVRYRNKLIYKTLVAIGVIAAIIYGIVILAT